MIEKIIEIYMVTLMIIGLLIATVFVLIGPLLLGLFVRSECYWLYIGSFVMSPVVLLMWSEVPKIISDLKEDL